VWWLPQPYLETVRTSYELTAAKRPSCSGFSQQLSWNSLTRRTSNSSLQMEIGEAVLSKPVLPDLTSLVPFNQEEADTRMLLHASHAAQHGHHAILIRTVDIDVVVLSGIVNDVCTSCARSCNQKTNCGWLSEQARVSDT